MTIERVANRVFSYRSDATGPWLPVRVSHLRIEGGSTPGRAFGVGPYAWATIDIGRGKVQVSGPWDGSWLREETDDGARLRGVVRLIRRLADCRGRSRA